MKKALKYLAYGVLILLVLGGITFFWLEHEMSKLSNFWEPMNENWKEFYERKKEYIEEDEKFQFRKPCFEGIKYIDFEVVLGDHFDEFDQKDKYIELSLGSNSIRILKDTIYFGPFLRNLILKIPTCGFGKDEDDYRIGVGINIYDIKNNKFIGFGGQNMGKYLKYKKVWLDLVPLGFDPGGPSSAGYDFRRIVPLEFR